MKSKRCAKCRCPLTLLRVSRTEVEARNLCVRCAPARPQKLLIDDMGKVQLVQKEFYARRKKY